MKGRKAGKKKGRQQGSKKASKDGRGGERETALISHFMELLIHSPINNSNKTELFIKLYLDPYPEFGLSAVVYRFISPQKYKSFTK